MAPWFVVAAVAAGAIPVPEVHGQEADSLPEAGLAQDGGAVEPVRVSLLPGLTFPPGVSLGLGLAGVVLANLDVRAVPGPEDSV